MTFLRATISALAFTASLAATPTFGAAISIGGVEFADESAFADQVLSINGNFRRYSGTGATLVPATAAEITSLLTDQRPDTFIIAGAPLGGQQVRLGFTDNLLINGTGADLALYELGFPDSFGVTINGVSRQYTSVFTGESQVGPYSNLAQLNVARIDLSDFGIAPGAALSEITVGLDILSAPGFTTSLSLAGAINSQRVVSEPATILLLMGAGLAALCRRRFS